MSQNLAVNTITTKRSSPTNSKLVPYSIAKQFSLEELRNEVAKINLVQLATIDPATLNTIISLNEKLTPVYSRLHKTVHLDSKQKTVNPVLSTVEKAVSSLLTNVNQVISFSLEIQNRDRGDALPTINMGTSITWLRAAQQSCLSDLKDSIANFLSLEIAPKPTSHKIVDLLKAGAVLFPLLAMKGESAPVTGLEKPVPSYEPPTLEIKQPTQIATTSFQHGLNSFSRVGETVTSGIDGHGSNERILAEISIPSGSKLKDPLWVDVITARNSEGSFIVCERRSKLKDPVHEEGRVTRISSLSPDVPTAIHLASPIGYGVAPIPGTRCQSNQIDSTTGQAILTSSATDQGRSSGYIVSEADEVLLVPPISSVPIVRDKDQELVINMVRQSSDKIPQILDRYFSSFIYLTSTQVNALIQQMPRKNREEIFAGIKIADCDSASMVAAGLLNEANQFGAVAFGVLLKDGKLSSSSQHAKLIYKDANDRPQTYETTAAMSGHYMNVTLSPEDHKRLEKIVSEMSLLDSPATRIILYSRFGDTLRSLLTKPEYQKFQVGPDLTENSSHSQLEGNILSSSKDDITLSFRDFWNFIQSTPFLLFAAAGATAYVTCSFFGKLAKIAHAKTKDFIQQLEVRREDRVIKALTVRRQEKTNKPSTGHHSTYPTRIDQTLNTLHCAVSPYVQNIYPRDRIATFDLSTKEEIIKLFALLYAMKRESGLLRRLTRQFLPWPWEHTVRRWHEQSFTPDQALHDIKARMPAHGSSEDRFNARIANLIATATKNINEPAKRPDKAQYSNSGNVPVYNGARYEDKNHTRGGDLSLYETREYVSGDDVRHINWPKSARSQFIQVKERQGASITHTLSLHLIIGLDQPQLGELTEILLRSKQHDTPIRISTITAIAHGDEVMSTVANSSERVGSLRLGEVPPFLRIILELQERYAPDRLRYPDGLIRKGEDFFMPSYALASIIPEHILKYPGLPIFLSGNSIKFEPKRGVSGDNLIRDLKARDLKRYLVGLR